jgi:hypothetical protein
VPSPGSPPTDSASATTGRGSPHVQVHDRNLSPADHRSQNFQETSSTEPACSARATQLGMAQRGRADWRRGCITAPSGCQGDTVARSEATQISKVPRPVVSGHRSVGVCDPGRSCPVTPRVRIIKWARFYSGTECLGAYLRRASVCSWPAAAETLGCVNHQDLEIAAAQLWPQTRSQGYFEGWGLVEREGEARVGLNELALPHPQDGRRFGRIYPHVPSACERRDRKGTALGFLGCWGRGLRRPDPTFCLAPFR